MKRRIRLRGINGDVEGRVWESDTILRAGRLATLEIVLDDTSVSRRHAEVRATSGGWRVRLNVAQALMCRSDLLLLDEPTNHLDLDAILWLETWLKEYPGTLLLIAHDREFLDRVTNRIVNLEHGKARAYRGNYSQFEEQRAAEMAEQGAMFARQQREIKQQDLFAQTTVADYLFAKDKLFAAMNLAPDELKLYDNVYKLLDAEMAKPDLVVYVRATIEVLAERLRKRNRDFERHISFDYLERVSSAYRDFFFYYDEAPLLVVDTSEIDFVANPEDLGELIREIDRAGPGTQYFVPRKS